MNTVIQELGRDVYEGFKTRNEASLILWELSEIPVTLAFDMIVKATDHHATVLAIEYEQGLEEEYNDIRYEREYRLGAMR